MPTTSEMLDGCVAIYVKAGTMECWACSGAGEKILISGFDIVAGERTSVPCDQCGGSGKLVPAPHDLGVSAAVTAELIRLVVQLRDASRWDAMNEALDWGSVYLTAGLEILLSDPAGNELVQTSIEKVVKAGAEVAQDMKDRPTIRPASGLSTQELEELGVLEP